MFIFECASCGVKWSAAPEPAGQASQCPQCRQTAPSFSLPDILAQARQVRPDRQARRDDEDDDGDEAEERPRFPKRAAGGGNTAGAAVVGAGLGAGMVVLIVLGVSACCLLTVGGIAVALLVPAIAKVREAAARTQSTNNLKMIGLAFQSFHDANKRLPFNGTGPAIGGNSTSGSWGFQILPYMDQQFLFQQVNRNAGIPFLLCPGRGRPLVESSNGGGAWSDYFLNNYLNDPLNAEKPNNPDNRRTLFGITDGTSNTIVVGHGNINTNQYLLSANVTLSSNIFQGGTAGTMRSGNNGATNPAGVTLQRDSANAPGIGSWGGPFSQGGLMCMGDASVRIFTYAMNNFGAFLTPTGGEAVIIPDF